MVFLLYGFINPEIDVNAPICKTFLKKSDNMDFTFEEQKKYFENKLDGIYFYSFNGRLDEGDEIVMFNSTFSFRTTYKEGKKDFGAEIDFKATLASIDEYYYMMIKGLFRTQDEMWEEE